MLKKFFARATAAVAATLLFSSTASAQLDPTNRACTVIVFSLTYDACAGFYNKNVLKSSAGGVASSEELTALQSIGFGVGPANVLG